MASTSTLTVSLVLICLFSIAIIGFAINFAVDNNSYHSISDNSDVDSFYSNTKTNLSTFNTESEDTYESIIGTTVEPGSDVLRTPGSFSITPKNMIGTFTNAIKLPYKYIFGGDGGGFGVFYYTLIGIIVLLFALFVIKTWRGNP
jgi:hypothetical protein